MKKIRPIAVCVFSNNGRILVAELQDRVSKEVFYRPLGGGIEFMETGEEAIQREIHEELHEEIENVKLLGYLENLFHHEGEPGHEIVIVFDGSFKNKALYEKSRLEGMEDNGDKIKAVWKDVSDFSENGCVLYPNAILELLNKSEKVK